MVFCGHQDQYSHWQFARAFVGSIVSFIVFIIYLVAFVDQYTETQRREARGRVDNQGERQGR
ncbi:hypothetical protein BDV29DRAFT_168175 [Aspergillus leporis]|uniref:Uncharacterized protein n=1 Tax=Aspergillus leporis TaxID=41062 RepID=A0A5N5XDL0_9EURO|nr:hypothetical protein BDV29DRAFT_168175 [Aspergillus leporis]